MKSLFAFVFVTILFTSCTPKLYTQVYEVKSDFAKDNSIIFENDTVRIQYYFWAPKGVLAFAITNKLNIPLYIDWKKSSFVNKGDKFDYWVDEQTGQYTTNYAAIQYKDLLSGWDVGRVTVGQSITNGKIIKPERITFLAPHSKIYRSPFLIYNPAGTLLRTDHKSENITNKENPKKITVVYVAEYTHDKTPAIFRNFLTISTSEKFEKESYIDNEFYISKITEMRSNEFRSDYTIVDNEAVYTFPYKADNCFYIEIDQFRSVEYRKKHETKTEPKQK